MREVEILRDGSWESIDFKDLKQGDVYRMFDDLEKTEPVVWEGRTDFICTTDAYLNDSGIWTVMSERVEDNE